MKRVFIFTFIVAGTIIGGPISFAVTNQETEYMEYIQIEKISYLYHPYNLTLFEPHNKEHHSGLGIIYLSDYQSDTMLKFIIIRTLQKSYLLYQMYLNELWEHKAEQIRNEFNDRIVSILSYNHSIGPNTMLVAGFVQNKQMIIKSTATNAFVLGIYHQLTPRTVLAIGASPAISKGSLDFRVTAGLQFLF